MALSQNSKILIDDINTALSGKIDTAGTGLSKDGTSLALATCGSAGTAGSSSAQTLTYGGTFTVPYVTTDDYGRVTAKGTRTLTMPATPTVTNISGTAAKTTTTPNVMCRIGKSGYGGSYDGLNYYKLPSGGTWAYVLSNYSASQASGGSSIRSNDTNDIVAIRIA